MHGNFATQGLQVPKKGYQSIYLRASPFRAHTVIENQLVEANEYAKVGKAATSAGDAVKQYLNRFRIAGYHKRGIPGACKWRL